MKNDETEGGDVYGDEADRSIEQEKKVGGTFRRYWSIDDSLKRIRVAPTLFDYEDPDIECFCNAD